MSVFDEQIGGNHYKKFPYQPAMFCFVNKLNFLEGNIIKYLCRFIIKCNSQDLEKASHYLDMLLELEKIDVEYKRLNIDEKEIWLFININNLGEGPNFEKEIVNIISLFLRGHYTTAKQELIKILYIGG